MKNIDRPPITTFGARKQLFDMIDELLNIWQRLGEELLMKNDQEIETLRKISAHLNEHGLTRTYHKY